MTVNYTSLLALGQPVTGTESGTWGDDVNNAVTSYLDIAIAGTLSLTSASFTANALTLANTQGTSSATNIAATTAQYMVLKVSSLAANVTINAPASSKLYLVDNADTTYTVTVKKTGGTGYTVGASTKAWVYYNGTDYVLVDTNDITKLTGTLPIANGGTNATATPTAGAVAYGTGTAYAFTSAGTTGQALTSNGASAPSFGTLGVAGGGTGLATTTAYGIITAGTTATGAFQQVSGTGTSGQVLTSNGASALPTWQNAAGNVTASGNNAFTGANTFYNATGQTFAQASTNDGIILQGRAGGTSSYRVTFTTATLSASRTVTLPDSNTTIPVATQVLTFSGPTAARTYTLPDSASTLAALATTQTFTATQTFQGTSSVLGMVVNDVAEVATVSATAATGTINYDVTTQSVLYYTTNASANWTVNLRGSSGTSLNTLMSTGQSITVAFLVTQGSTAYYNSSFQVDGTATGVTIKWQGGTAPTSGNASSIDVYTYTVIKTGSATYTVFASQTKFA